MSKFLINPNDFVKTFLAVTIAVFWSTRRIYYNKWEYLANLYNNIPDIENLALRNKRYYGLAFDILTVQFWGHKSFFDIFNPIVEKYVESVNENYKTGKDYYVINYNVLNEWMSLNDEKWVLLVYKERPFEKL
jgi:hypothetical protein